MKYIKACYRWTRTKFLADKNQWHKLNYIFIGLLLGLVIGFFSFHEQSDLDRRVRDIAVASYPNDKEKQNLAVQDFRASVDELYEFSERGGVDQARKDALDQETRTDLNELHARLEDYFNDNGSYPTTLSQSVLVGATYDSFVDREGKFIKIETSNSSQEPADYFGLSLPDARYRYGAYGCEVGTGQTQDFCRSYVLFGWLDTGGVYSRKSLN